MLQMKNVALSGVAGKKTVHILQRINLTIPNVGRVLITGPSGSGKTALLRLIAGREFPSRGEILINGESTSHWNDKNWSAFRRRTAEAGEDLLLPDRTLLENAALCARIAGWRGSDARRKGEEALASLGLRELGNSLPDELSGEERRLGAIACAMAREPDILLVDEPEDGLQESSAAAVLSALRAAGEQRLVVVASRRSELFFGEEVRVITLSEGQIDSDTAEQGEKVEVKSLPAAPDAGISSLGMALGNLPRRAARVAPRLLVPFLASLLLCLLLSVLSGAETYERALQLETLAAYPITLTTDSLPSGDLEALAGWLEQRTDGKSLSVHRTYAIEPVIYSSDTSSGARQVNPQPGTGAALWTELPDGESLREARYQLLSGRWPAGRDEAVIVLNVQGVLDSACASALGLSDEQILRGMSYPELLRLVYRVVFPTEEYVENVDGTWSFLGGDSEFMTALVKRSLSLKIVGIVRPGKDLAGGTGVGGAAFTSELTQWVASSVLESEIVQAQLAAPDRDVVSGLKFDTNGLLDADADAQRTMLSRYAVSLSAGEQAALYAAVTGTSVEENRAQDTLLQTLETLEEGKLASLYEQLITAGTVPASMEQNLRSFGATAAETITALQLYASSFSYRGTASALLKNYSETISYTDPAAGIISSGAKLMTAASGIYWPLRVLGCVLAALFVLFVGAQAVATRRRENAVLRCRGLSAGSLSAAIGWESFLLGLLGSLAGVLVFQVIAMVLPEEWLELRAGLSWRDTAIVAAGCTLCAWLAGRAWAGISPKASPADALRQAS